MNILLFAHPDFLDSQSMPRYTRMLADSLIRGGHKIEIWKPKPRLYNFTSNKLISKWLGYIDQYIIFPMEVRMKLKSCQANTLFVFTDNALGPWVPLVANRPHVIHCHDFLAQYSALGRIPECRTSWSGRKYQSFIRRGYQHGKNFISVSRKTQQDLHRFLTFKPACSEVVYNALNQPFMPCNIMKARNCLGRKVNIAITSGYILHVGGNQWYKNRSGVIEIYSQWRLVSNKNLPLLMIGQPPTASLLQTQQESLFKSDIHFVSDIKDQYVQMAYAGASVFIFPSLAEGFGWPIAEAMASGVPVVTTNEPPMTEVAGNAGFTIPRRPVDSLKVKAWAIASAKVLNKAITLSGCERRKVIETGLINSKRFDAESAAASIEAIYKDILARYDL